MYRTICKQIETGTYFKHDPEDKNIKLYNLWDKIGKPWKPEGLRRNSSDLKDKALDRVVNECFMNKKIKIQKFDHENPKGYFISKYSGGPNSNIEAKWTSRMDKEKAATLIRAAFLRHKAKNFFSKIIQ